MLTITITKTALYFKNLSVDDQEKLSNEFGLNFKINQRGDAYITDKPENLYYLLYKITNVYDVEL